IDVPEGGMVALLGANGAGKSTTLKSISGLLTAERGEVRRGELQFRGQSIGGLMPQDRVKLGIAHVLEGRRVFEHLTPDENLIAASALHSRQDM
ncbi:ATP-binding cassette domain-containing protein, partial [Escherichia coli]